MSDFHKELEERERRKLAAVASLRGKTIESAELTDEETDRDFDRLTLTLTDGSRVVIESNDGDGYRSWLGVEAEG